MFDSLRLPPIYRLVAVGRTKSAAAEACRLAKRGADPATLVCARRRDLLDCAIVLHPERTLAESRLVIYVAGLGLGDALGVVVPPGVDVTYRWPNAIEANLGTVARLVAPPDARAGDVPDWLVLRAEAALGPKADSPPPAGFETTLAAEGAPVAPDALLDAYARHFLAWLNRWLGDGFAPIRAMWLRHSAVHGETVRLAVGGRGLRGVFRDIADDGALLLEGPKSTRRVALERVLGG